MDLNNILSKIKEHKAKIIRYVAIGVLAVLLVSEFLPGPGPTPPPKKVATPSKKPKARADEGLQKTPPKRPPPAQKKAPQETPADPMAQESPPPAPIPPPEESLDDPLAQESPPLQEEIEDDEITIEQPPPSQQEQAQGPEGITEEVENNVENIDISKDLGEVINQVEKKIQQTGPSPKTEKSIPHVSAPSYQNFGRGLVYNCSGKHWACVDRESWFQCIDNRKYNDRYGKDLECYPVNVYQTSEDCRTVQVYNINTNQKKDFCFR